MNLISFLCQLNIIIWWFMSSAESLDNCYGKPHMIQQGLGSWAQAQDQGLGLLNQGQGLGLQGQSQKIGPYKVKQEHHCCTEQISEVERDFFCNDCSLISIVRSSPSFSALWAPSIKTIKLVWLPISQIQSRVSINPAGSLSSIYS